jgi:hypothetical protein
MSEVIKEFRSNGVVSLWHLTHIDNVCSIINQGILNHYLAHDNYVLYSDDRVSDGMTTVVYVSSP